MAAAQSAPFWYLIVVSIIAAVGKTIASVILFVIADRAEDIVLNKIGRFVGVTHKQIESFGARFSGRPRDYLTLFVIRMTPIIPSAPISLICGFIAIPMRLFVVTTFFGTIIRDFIYLYIGYTGIEAARVLIDGIEGVSSIITIIMLIIAVAIGGWILYRKFHKPHKLSGDGQAARNKSKSDNTDIDSKKTIK